MVSGIFKFHKLYFFVGIIAVQKINIGGEFFVGELLAVAYLLFNVDRIKNSKFERCLLAFALLWFIAQVLSDIINDTKFIDSLKGCFAPIVFSFSIIGLIGWLKNCIAGLPSFLLGSLLGGVIYLQIFPSEYYLANPWKWGLGGAVFSLVFIYYSFFAQKKSKLTIFAMILCASVISLVFDSRGSALFPMASFFAYLFIINKKTQGVSRYISGRWGLIKLFAVFLPVVFIINVFASEFFSSDVVLSRLSSQSAEKYRTQATGKYGLLLGGRSEVLISMQAFIDKPLLGHGSWVKDKHGYIDQYKRIRNLLGYGLSSDDSEFEKTGLIPTHSYIMGALVWAGIFGGLFWLFICYSTIINFIQYKSVLPLYFYMGLLNLWWSILFSPFGAESRWAAALFISSFFAYTQRLCKNIDSTTSSVNSSLKKIKVYKPHG